MRYFLFALALATTAGCTAASYRPHRGGSFVGFGDPAGTMQAIAGGEHDYAEHVRVERVEAPRAQAQAYATVRAADRSSAVLEAMLSCMVPEPTPERMRMTPLERLRNCRTPPRDWDEVARVLYIVTQAEGQISAQQFSGMFNDPNLRVPQWWYMQMGLPSYGGAPSPLYGSAEPQTVVFAPPVDDRRSAPQPTRDEDMERLRRRMRRQEQDLTELGEIMHQQGGGR